MNCSDCNQPNLPIIPCPEDWTEFPTFVKVMPGPYYHCEACDNIMLADGRNSQDVIGQLYEEGKVEWAQTPEGLMMREVQS
jgi:hypothetical protein